MKWREIFQSPVVSSALTERLTHQSHVLNMNRPSYRMKEIEEWLLNSRQEVVQH